MSPASRNGWNNDFRSALARAKSHRHEQFSLRDNVTDRIDRRCRMVVQPTYRYTKEDAQLIVMDEIVGFLLAISLLRSANCAFLEFCIIPFLRHQLDLPSAQTGTATARRRHCAE